MAWYKVIIWQGDNWYVQDAHTQSTAHNTAEFQDLVSEVLDQIQDDRFYTIHPCDEIMVALARESITRVEVMTEGQYKEWLEEVDDIRWLNMYSKS